MSELTNDQYIHRLEENNAILQSQLKASQDEVKRLREALGYYADEVNWWLMGDEFARSWRYDEDGYLKAKQALNKEGSVSRNASLEEV